MSHEVGEACADVKFQSTCPWLAYEGVLYGKGHHETVPGSH